MTFAIIFDMEGVLIDSLWPVIESIKFIAKNYGIKYDGFKEFPHRWSHLVSLLEENDPGKKVPVDESGQLATKFQMDYLSKTPNRPGIVKFLEELTEKNILMIVCTNSKVERCVQMLEQKGIKDFFQKIVAFEDINNRKPHPEMLLKATEELNLKPEQCIVFEDSGESITAAKKEGMKTLGFHNVQRDIKELKDADLIINSFEDIDYELLHELVSKE